VCFFLTALAAVALAATEAARAQVSGTVTSTVTASGPDPLIFESGASIVTDGQAGINITGSANLSINPGTVRHSITTTGSNAPGIRISSGNHTVTLNDLDITTSGPAGSDGIRVENPNTPITATSVVINTTGAANALNVIANNEQSISFTGGMLTSAAGAVINLAGNLDIVTLTNTTVTAAGPDGRWLATSGNPDTVNAIGSMLSGTARTSAGTSNLNLSSNTVWNMTGNSNVTNLTVNNSDINFAPPAAGADLTMLSSYKTLTVNMLTSSSGEIHMNTCLSAESSPNNRIVI